VGHIIKFLVMGNYDGDEAIYLEYAKEDANVSRIVIDGFVTHRLSVPPYQAGINDGSLTGATDSDPYTAQGWSTELGREDEWAVTIIAESALTFSGGVELFGLEFGASVREAIRQALTIAGDYRITLETSYGFRTNPVQGTYPAEDVVLVSKTVYNQYKYWMHNKNIGPDGQSNTDDDWVRLAILKDFINFPVALSTWNSGTDPSDNDGCLFSETLPSWQYLPGSGESGRPIIGQVRSYPVFSKIYDGTLIWEFDGGPNHGLMPVTDVTSDWHLTESESWSTSLTALVTS